MNSLLAKILSLIILMIIASTSAYAKIEVQNMYNCGNDGTLKYIIFRDDNTGKRWLLREWCNGTSWIDPLSTISANPTEPITVSPNFADQCAVSRSITSPGVNLGVTITDANNQVFEFRNCLNEQERTEGREAWERELQSDPTLSLLYRPHGLGAYAQEVLLSSFKQNATQEDLLGSQLASDYIHSKYNTSDANFIDELSKDKVFAYIIINNTDIAIEAAPTAQNNYQLKVRSVDPKVEVATEILNSSGQTVWKNSVGTATPVDMSQFSSGTYFVKGTGQPIPVTIVR